MGGGCITIYPMTSRIPALDGVRAVAALLVMFFHFSLANQLPEAIKKLSSLGQTGVDLFFVLSGFLITRILVSSRSSPYYFSHFYIRRALRIMPLYYLFLMLWFFVRPVLFSIPTAPFLQQVWSWLFLENIPLTFTAIPTQGPNPYWSLAVEEHFYLLWPMLVYALPHRSLKGMLLAIIFLSPAVRMLFLAHGWGVYYFTFTRIDSLAFGALVAVIYNEYLLQWHHFRWVVRVLLTGLPVLLVLLFIRYSGSHAGWLQVLKLSLTPFCFALLMVFLLIDQSSLALRRVFTWNWMRWLGRISYGLYIFHGLVFEAVDHCEHSGNVWLRLTLCFGLTALIAHASYELFESKILALKEKFKYEATL